MSGQGRGFQRGRGNFRSNNNTNRSGRSGGRGNNNNRRSNHSNHNSNNNNKNVELKFVPHYSGKQQMVTYDTVKDHVIHQIQKNLRYGIDMAKALRDM